MNNYFLLGKSSITTMKHLLPTPSKKRNYSSHFIFLSALILFFLICGTVLADSNPVIPLTGSAITNPSLPKILPVAEKNPIIPGIIPFPLSHTKQETRQGVRAADPEVIPGCRNCSQDNITTKGITTEDSISSEAVNARVAETQEYIKLHHMNWTAGITSVSNLSPEAYQRLLGAVPQDVPGAVVQPDKSLMISIEGLPSTFDWRNNGGDWTTPIRDQRSCGSCWAFASTGVFESYQERRYGNPDLNPDYSEQYLVSCNQDGWSCSGGWISFPYFINTAGKTGGVGTVSETDYPYISSTGTCKSLSGYTRYTAPSGAYWGYVGSSSGIPSVDQIKNALYTHGPLYSGLSADSNFQNYVKGVFSGSSTNVNHGVVIVGWGSDGGGTYWICKNSWGTGWGEYGWFRIYAGANRIGYAAAYMYLPSFPPPTIVSITPLSATRNTTAQISNLAGSNFVSGCTVALNRTGNQDIAATNVQVLSSGTISCSVSLTSSTPGKWNVRVTNPDGKSAVLNNGFEVLSDIHARFYGVPETTVNPLTIHFFDVSTGNAIDRLWNFGDDTSSTERNPVKTFTGAGTYLVTLTVDDGFASSQAREMM